MFGISLLTLGVNNSAYANIPDIFVASSLFVAIIFSGPFSGGHVNPAVTMGINILYKFRLCCKKIRHIIYLSICILDCSNMWWNFRLFDRVSNCWICKCANDEFLSSYFN